MILFFVELVWWGLFVCAVIDKAKKQEKKHTYPSLFAFVVPVLEDRRRFVPPAMITDWLTGWLLCSLYRYTDDDDSVLYYISFYIGLGSSVLDVDRMSVVTVMSGNPQDDDQEVSRAYKSAVGFPSMYPCVQNPVSFGDGRPFHPFAYFLHSIYWNNKYGTYIEFGGHVDRQTLTTVCRICICQLSDCDLRRYVHTLPMWLVHTTVCMYICMPEKSYFSSIDWMKHYAPRSLPSLSYNYHIQCSLFSFPFHGG